jgi:hypothetical protein
MKMSAHPVLVAVALGLLGPNALAEESEDAPEGLVDPACDGCTCERGLGVQDQRPAPASQEGAQDGALSSSEGGEGAGWAAGCERLRTPEEEAMDEAVAKLWAEWVQAS